MSASEEWVRVASVDEIEAGELKEVIVFDKQVCLANVGGEFLAIGNICSHEYVELSDGWLEGDEVECPAHGSLFSMRTGEVRGMPATSPVPAYEVKVESEGVYVRGPGTAAP